MLPSEGHEQPEHEVDERGLARPRRPGDAERRAHGEYEVDALQGGLAVRCGYAKRTSLEHETLRLADDRRR